MTSKCDIIRDLGKANMCGMCQSPPMKCDGNIPQVVCKIPQLCNLKMQLFNLQYMQPFEDETLKSKIESIYEADINKIESDLKAAYKIDADISWFDITQCLWHQNGAKDGYFNNEWFSRDDAMALGMAPIYPIGGELGKNLFKKQYVPVPLYVDYLMNPNLFLFIIIVFLLLTAFILAYEIRNRSIIESIK